MRTISAGLSAIEKEARQGYLGGSDANILMRGDPAAILELWKVKTGQAEPTDLSGVLPVVMGSWTEELNRFWFEKNTGRVITSEGDAHIHPEHPFMACTLDGLTVTGDMQKAIFEAKHVNAFAKLDDVVQRYMPQCHHNMAVMGVNYAVLSVFLGTMNWEFVEIARDDWYLAELIDRERQFWEAVQTRTPPVEMPAVAAPVSPEKFRTVDMTGSNSWSKWASEWIENQAQAKRFVAAEKELKALVDADVAHAHGHGIEIKRAKNGSLRVRAQ